MIILREQKQYYQFTQFAHIYLEDSYILKIKTYANCVEFVLELVLTENHPLYKKPFPNRQYCYKKAKIIFQNCKNINWIEKTDCFNQDVDGEIDYGNIDWFYCQDNLCSLGGEWGKLEVSGATMVLRVLN